jgi:hypothetical protein
MSWLQRKFQAEACKFEVREGTGPSFNSRPVSKHLTKEKAILVAQKLNEESTKNYFVRPL